MPPSDNGAFCEETGIYLPLMESMVRETFVSRAIRVGVVSEWLLHTAQVPRPHSAQ